ncbi:MAG: helix-turn-helix transcriptional regulator [Ruminococcus sp.]|nr:helix-turn-helix transcriptional regulator [Ruminococcus sp.]
MDDTNMNAACGNVKRLDIKRVEQLLRSGCIEDCGAELDSILEDISFQALKSLVLRLYVATDIYLAARTFTDEIGIPNEDFVEKFGNVDDIDDKLLTVDGTTSYLHNAVEQCIRWRMEKARDSGSNPVKLAREYIDSNYMHEDISLSSVAYAVGLSPAYLSALFKKETGRKLSEYLNLVRIDRSKELLCCTSKMIYEIAFEVGFQDYRYFSQIFKKYTGQTPRQFQNNVNINV